MHWFPHKFPTVQENATKLMVWESMGNWYSYFSHSMVAFFPLGFHPVVYFIIWKMHGFPHQFPKLRENATKPKVWGKSGKLKLILFP